MCVLLILMGVFFLLLPEDTRYHPPATTEGLFKVWFVIIEIRNEKKRHNQMFETESFIYHKLSRKK